MREQRERRRSNGGNGSGTGNSGGNYVLGKVASVSSIDQIRGSGQLGGGQQEEWLSQDELMVCSSDELDKLSMCLSEASSENADRRRPSLLSDIVQAQLALWTLVITVFYSYAWQQHRKKFLLSLFVVVPPVLLLICTLSSLLTAIVILGRLFSTPLRFQDIVGFQTGDDAHMEESEGESAGFGSSGIRRRTASGASCASVGRALSNSCEELPKPMCRKHSTNGSSLSLYGGSNGGSGGGSGSLNGALCSGLVGRSDSIGNGQMTIVSTQSGGSGRLAHQYSHFPSDGTIEPQLQQMAA